MNQATVHTPERDVGPGAVEGPGWGWLRWLGATARRWCRVQAALGRGPARVVPWR